MSDQVEWIDSRKHLFDWTRKKIQEYGDIYDYRHFYTYPDGYLYKRGDKMFGPSLDNMYNVNDLNEAVELIRELRDEVRTIREQLDLFVEDRAEAIEQENERWNSRFGGGH